MSKKTTITCSFCGKISTRYKKRVLASQMFCNRECRTGLRRKLATSPYKEVVHLGQRKYEHRLIMEREVGRPLTKKEHVHHIDGDTRNNAVANLAVLSASDHAKIHSQAQTKWGATARLLAADGLTTTEIANRIGVPTRYVWRHLNLHGIKTPRAKKNTKVNVDLAKNMLLSGASLREIGRHLGISHQAIAAALRRK
jgi:DNA-binding CsgD family transcriptional regulator